MLDGIFGFSEQGLALCITSVWIVCDTSILLLFITYNVLCL